MKKVQRDEKHVYIGSSTTFKVDAGNKRYHCLFFCQRQTGTDVFDPRESKSESMTSSSKKDP